MRDYFIRRFLLIIPTMIGLTMLVFAITRFVPGGPVEQAVMRARQASAEGGRGGGARGGGQTELSEDQLNKLKAYYGFDKPLPLAYLSWLGKVCQGDLGTSQRYNVPVWELIRERMPVATYFGVVTLVLSYLVCIPLGMLKALKHRTTLDTSSSALIFAGYAIPNFALGALLVVFLATRWKWFPSRGFTSEDFDDLTTMGKAWDILRHTTLPLVCYLIGDFAFLTMMKKNSLMDNLAADYMRTSVSKGSTFAQAVRRHALRNSFIPIATSLGHALSVFVAGSFLIEVVFDIDGLGLLGYDALLGRDYPIVMGELVVVALITLLGNILSDFFVALTDPRVRFD